MTDPTIFIHSTPFYHERSSIQGGRRQNADLEEQPPRPTNVKWVALASYSYGGTSESLPKLMDTSKYDTYTQ